MHFYKRGSIVNKAWIYCQNSSPAGRNASYTYPLPGADRRSMDWETEKLLCPVRPLREYISRTKQIRRSQQALFVCYKKGQHHKQATRALLARWVKDTIELAENKRPDKPSTGKAHIHQLRGISHTLAFESGASLEHVLLEKC